MDTIKTSADQIDLSLSTKQTQKILILDEEFDQAYKYHYGLLKSSEKPITHMTVMKQNADSSKNDVHDSRTIKEKSTIHIVRDYNSLNDSSKELTNKRSNNTVAIYDTNKQIVPLFNANRPSPFLMVLNEPVIMRKHSSTVSVQSLREMNFDNARADDDFEGLGQRTIEENDSVDNVNAHSSGNTLMDNLRYLISDLVPSKVEPLTTHDRLSRIISPCCSDSEENQKYNTPIEKEELPPNVIKQLSSLLTMEREHLICMAEIRDKLKTIVDRRIRSISGASLKSFYLITEAKVAQEKLIDMFDLCIKTKDSTFIEKLSIYIYRQNVITAYLNNVADVTNYLESKKTDQDNTSNVIFLLQKPMTWILQTLGNIELLLDSVLLDTSTYVVLKSIYEQLLTNSTTLKINANQSLSSNGSSLQARLIMHNLVVELINYGTDDRKLRYLFLFSDVLVSAKPKVSRSFRKRLKLGEAKRSTLFENKSRLRRSVKMNANLTAARSISTTEQEGLNQVTLEAKWFIPTAALKVHATTKIDIDDRKRLEILKQNDDLKERIKRLRKECKECKDVCKSSYSKYSTIQSELGKLEGQLVLETPQLILPISNGSHRIRYILLVTERECTRWRVAMERECQKAKSALGKDIDDGFGINDLLLKSNSNLDHRTKSRTDQIMELARVRSPTMVEINNRLKQHEHLARVNKIGYALISNEEGVTGIIEATMHGIEGLNSKESYHVRIEVDSYGQFEEVARTHISQSPNPQWNQSFNLEVDDVHTICFCVYTQHTAVAELQVPVDSETIKEGSSTQMKVYTNEQPPRELIFSIALKLLQRECLVGGNSRNVKGKIFGRPIEELVEQSSVNKNTSETSKLTDEPQLLVPEFVTVCIKEVERRGLSEEGLYRICGSNNDVANLKEAFELNFHSGIERLQLFEMPVITSLLKQFFHELPEPLINSSVTYSLMEAADIPNRPERIKALQAALMELPAVNLETLNFLVHHLIYVSTHQKENKMNLGNLSLIWSASLFDHFPCKLSCDQPNAMIPENLKQQVAVGFQQTKAMSMILFSVEAGKLILQPQPDYVKNEYPQQYESET